MTKAKTTPKPRKSRAKTATAEQAPIPVVLVGSGVDDSLTGDPEDAPRSFTGSDEIMQFEPLLKLEPEAFEAAIAENADVPIADEKVYGLLALERNGQNRTPYVRAAMKRLDLTADELPGGGPGYTNDVRPISKL